MNWDPPKGFKPGKIIAAEADTAEEAEELTITTVWKWWREFNRYAAVKKVPDSQRVAYLLYVAFGLTETDPNEVIATYWGIYAP